MNKDLLPLFSDWNDALGAVVHALGGFKKVGVDLRPEYQTRPEAASRTTAVRDWVEESRPRNMVGFF